jgi:hypothetical protein
VDFGDWTCSIALLPFWCLDAKGGEVVLLGICRDLHGWKHKLARLSFFGACVSSYFVCLKSNFVCG